VRNPGSTKQHIVDRDLLESTINSDRRQEEA
jgi:hypothetical protein